MATTGKEVRRAKFYWSRDPDLPYRIWTAIIHEDGSAPIIPDSVEDAKSKFLDVVKLFEIPASALGRGSHKIVGSVDIAWGRRSYLEKGSALRKDRPGRAEDWVSLRRRWSWTGLRATPSSEATSRGTPWSSMRPRRAFPGE